MSELTLEEIKKIYGVDPNAIGCRNRGHYIEGDTLWVRTRDAGIDFEDDIDRTNYLGSQIDDFDCTYRHYLFRPLKEGETGESASEKVINLIKQSANERTKREVCADDYVDGMTFSLEDFLQDCHDSPERAYEYGFQEGRIFFARELLHTLGED